MSINIKVISAFAIVSAGLVSSIAPQVDAAYRRAHSSECHSYYDNVGTDLYNGAYIRNYGTTSRGVYCPVATDGYLPHASAGTLNVHGYEASGESNSSRACVKHYNNSGTACGSTKYWGSAYTGVNGVSVDAWTSNPYSFPYVYNVIDVGGYLYGFFITD